MNGLHLKPDEVLARIAAQRRPRPSLETNFVRPAAGEEQIIANCWEEVLGIEPIGVDDNFFNLGGDSLHMTRIASRLNERCGVELPMTQFFSDPTIAALAKFVRSARERESTGSDRSDRVVISTTPRVTAATRPQPSVVSHGLIATVAIATAGRPAALERCLAGLTRMLRQYDRAPRILITDGSEDAPAAAANRRIVDRAAQEYRGAIALADRDAIQSFAARLVEAGFEKDLISFSLPGTDEFRLGSRLGASRNLHLLATAGEAILSLDDDIDCRFAPAPELNAEGIGVDLSADDPAQVWIYPDRRTLLSTLPFGDYDLVAGHEKLLGQTTAEARVRVTLGGLAGDCGWGTPSCYLFIDDASFRRLAATDESYRAGVTSREMLRVAPRWLVSGRVENLIAATFAADGRTPLPPFVPIGRGSDVVFGRLLKAIEPAAAFGHLPWAIQHEPIESRRFSPGEILRSASTTDVKGMFCALLTDRSVDWNRSARGDLAAARRHLTDLANLPAPDFLQQLIDGRTQQIDGEIEFLTQRLSSLGSVSPASRRDLETYRASLAHSRGEATSAVPAELLYRRELPTAVEDARRIARLFAQLLGAWPEMLAQTQTLRRAGIDPFTTS
jgi:acyl carrier protein